MKCKRPLYEKTEPFRWLNMMPLTQKEACQAVRNGIIVFAVSKFRTTAVTTIEQFCKAARTNCIFMADRQELINAATYYEAVYVVRYPEDDNWPTPKKLPTITKTYPHPYDARIDSENALNQLAQQHNLPDGRFWIELYLRTMRFGELEETREYDENYVTFKDGVAVEVPTDFILPF